MREGKRSANKFPWRAIINISPPPFFRLINHAKASLAQRAFGRVSLVDMASFVSPVDVCVTAAATTWRLPEHLAESQMSYCSPLLLPGRTAAASPPSHKFASLTDFSPLSCVHVYMSCADDPDPFDKFTLGPIWHKHPPSGRYGRRKRTYVEIRLFCSREEHVAGRMLALFFTIRLRSVRACLLYSIFCGRVLRQKK